MQTALKALEAEVERTDAVFAEHGGEWLTMRLELAEFPVKEIRLGRAMRYQSGTLEVDKQALEEMILRDGRIAEASLAVVRPGDNVRITGIR